MEYIATIICPIVTVVISIIALFKSNEAIKIANKIEKKQEANGNSNSNINQKM